MRTQNLAKINDIKSRIESTYLVKSMLPIMVLYSINSILFQNSFFNEHFEFLFEIIGTGYAIFLALLNIFLARLKGDKTLVWSMLAFSIINLISFCITFDGSLFPFIMAYMIPVHYLAFGLPRIDQQPEQRRNEIDKTIFIFAMVAFGFDVVLLIVEASRGGFGPIIHGSARLSGIAYSASSLSQMACIVAFFNIYMLLKSPRKRWKIFAAISFVVQILVLAMTKTRGSMLFLLAAVGILILIELRHRLSNKTFWITIAFIAAIFIAFILLIVFSRGVDTTLGLYDFLNKLSTKRLDLFVAGINAGFDSPIYGNSYSTLTEAYAPNKMAHNLYIDLFARYGIFSLIAFLVFAISLVIKSIRIIGNRKLAKEDYLLFIFSFAFIVASLLQHFIDVYIFFTGYGTLNVFFVILCGYLSYHISKAEYN